MFTGIVEEVGTVESASPTGGGLRIAVGAQLVPQGLGIGDSIAVSGCCLTAVAVHEAGFEAELSGETMAKTAPRWRAGQRVNLERAMAADGRFGGHLVSGHVDGVGRVAAREQADGAVVMTIRAPDALARYLVAKGSVTVDGVSLTVVDLGGPAGTSRELDENEFTLWLIPHTLEVTTLGGLYADAPVNLEADLIAKYLERLQATKEIPHVPS